MRLGFEEEASPYEGPTQSARFWSENWVAAQLYCLNCGGDGLTRMPNNSPVADFVCGHCRDEFELKSQRKQFFRRIVDGAYRTMIDRLGTQNNPNLILLGYDRANLRVSNLAVVPKHFFVPDIIEERAPLAPTARRAGWVGCNILLDRIPDAGKIHVVRNGLLTPKDIVLEQWRRTAFLREERIETRGWLLDVLKCVEEIDKTEFTIADVYAFEAKLQALYPSNGFVRAKVRQQLQVLRDRGFIEFVARGRYRLKV